MLFVSPVSFLCFDFVGRAFLHSFLSFAHAGCMWMKNLMLLCQTNGTGLQAVSRAIEEEEEEAVLVAGCECCCNLKTKE